MTTIPSFLTFDSVTKTIEFNPIESTPTGEHNVSVTITDGLDNPIYSFKVVVK
jgi:hypothetical protein